VAGEVRMEGLEPPRAEAHQDLNLARIPIPPHPRGEVDYGGTRGVGHVASHIATFRTQPPRANYTSPPGAVAQLVVASVSKTEGPRFESWLPRLQPPRVALESGRKRGVGVVAYLLFFLAGLGFGFAAVGKWKWLPLIFPLLLWVGAVLVNGVDSTSVIRLIVALVVMVVGILLGILLDSREQRGTAAQTG
jgi:hypothetical protein